MLEFINLIIINGNVFSIRTDDIIDFSDICNAKNVINSSILVTIRSGDDTYTLDISNMLIDHPALKYSLDISDFLSKLTPVIIYTYQTNIFNTSKFIRCFSDSDLPGETVISPYSIDAAEEVNYTDMPSHNDIIIRCNNYDLSRVIPVIDGKLRYCLWNDGKIMIPDSVDIARTTENIDFLSFNEDPGCNLLRCKNVDFTSYQLPNNTIPILVLCGHLFYDDPSIYTFNRLTNRIKLNSQFIISKFNHLGYTDVEAILSDRDSFIILVNAANIFIRNILVAKVGVDNRKVLSYYETYTWNNHTDYICLDDKTNMVRGLVALDEKYKYVNRKDDPMEHHAYVRNDVEFPRLIQLVLC